MTAPCLLIYNGTVIKQSRVLPFSHTLEKEHGIGEKNRNLNGME